MIASRDFSNTLLSKALSLLSNWPLKLKVFLFFYFILELLFKKKRKREQKMSSLNSAKSTHDKPLDTNKTKTNVSSTIKTEAEDLTLNKTLSSSSTPSLNFNEVIKTESANNLPNVVSTPIVTDAKTKEEPVLTSYKNTINDEEINAQIVNRLEEIYKKYKHAFEADDSADFETILENLKSNLSD